MSELEQRPEQLPEQQLALEHANWTDSGVGKILASGMLVAAISPINEALRFAAVGFALKYGDPAIAALVAGTTTMAIEAGGAIVAADVLDSNGGKSLVEKTNDKIEKAHLDGLLHTNTATEAGVAIIAGSAVVTVIKHRQDTDRTREQNRVYGTKASAGISIMSSIQAFAIGEGLHYPSPVTIGLAALAVGASIGGFKWASKKVKDGQESNVMNSEQEEHDKYPFIERITTSALDDEPTINRSIDSYNSLTYDDQAPQHLGLSGEEVAKALKNPDVIKTVYINEHGEEVYLPFLVPIKDLYWYNKPYLVKQFGTDNLYYFAHASGEFDDNDARGRAINEIISNGGVIIYDVSNQPEQERNRGNLLHIFKTTNEIDNPRVGGGENGSFLNQYEGTVVFNGNPDLPFTPQLSVYEQFLQGIESGEIEFDPENGTAFADVIKGDEAEQIWSFYNTPFIKISEKNPIGAGYDKEGFMELLSDPSVIKCVNRQDGKVTTLSLYVNDLDKCPWLNEEYYKAQYPDAFDTKNLFISLGIVADESVKTGTRSVSMINLMMKTMALRKTPVVIAFECNDVSYKYIPRIVQFATNHAGPSHIEGVRDVQSQLNFFAITAGKIK